MTNKTSTQDQSAGSTGGDTIGYVNYADYWIPYPACGYPNCTSRGYRCGSCGRNPHNNDYYYYKPLTCIPTTTTYYSLTSSTCELNGDTTISSDMASHPTSNFCSCECADSLFCE